MKSVDLKSAALAGPGIEGEAALDRSRPMRKIIVGPQVTLPFDGLQCSLRRMLLRPLRDGNTREYAVQPIGMIEGASLLVPWPADSGGLIPLRSGEVLQVKFFTERELVMFTVDVESCVFLPRPYIHLGWPREVSCVEVRGTSRTPIEKPAVLNRVSEAGIEQGAQMIGKVVDLSLNGAAFVSSNPALQVGDEGELVLSVHVEAGQPALYIHPRCKVRSRREVGGDLPAWHYGLELLKLNTHDRLVVLAILGEGESRRHGRSANS